MGPNGLWNPIEMLRNVIGTSWHGLILFALTEFTVSYSNVEPNGLIQMQLHKQSSSIVPWIMISNLESILNGMVLLKKYAETSLQNLNSNS